VQVFACRCDVRIPSLFDRSFAASAKASRISLMRQTGQRARDQRSFRPPFTPRWSVIAMSSYRIRQLATKVDPPGVEGSIQANPTIETATYVADMLKGVRQMSRAGSRDLALLDYLLAMAEEEAACLAANIYH
jgi:hypothetical protein